ncbi:MAG: hypothetical protein JO104_11325 [Candidatus Eremiobacteraeota bacterium]|nr:hypothetical protein [Candidatus Eremiobacteraeota bacterium]
MTRASCRALALLVALIGVIVTPNAARATVEVDPTVLYGQMKDAYAKGAAAGWDFRSEATYLSTIFNAGRAYSLQYPNDPAYGELATLTVAIGTGLHYNPLTNHDAAVWWVREAADWVMKHSEEPQLIMQAQALLLRVNSEDDTARLARLADADATANVRAYPGDVDALLIQVEADWRAWLLTSNPMWRSLAFARAAAPSFPVAHLPTTWGNELVASADRASTQSGYTRADVANATTFITRLKAVDPIRVIATVNAMPHDVYLTTLAPADEYFGPLNMSILEIENRLKHINFMLDYNYGNNESDPATDVAHAIVDMQKVYPRDRDLPMLIYWCYTTLQRMTDQQSRETARALKAILTVEYQDSPQARKLLGLT